MYRKVLVLALVPLYAAFFIALTAPDIPDWTTRLQIPRPLVPLNIRDRLFRPRSAWLISLPRAHSS